MDFLPDSDISIIVDRQIGETDNELVRLLVDEDGDEMSEVLYDKFVMDDNITDIQYDSRDGKLIFKVMQELGDDTETNQKFYLMDTSRSLILILTQLNILEVILVDSVMTIG